MLATAGLRRGRGLRDGAARRLRPEAHIEHRRHRRVPRLQEQRAGQLERAGIDVRPVRPGRLRRARLVRRASTPVAQFLDEHPTAAEDFVRATMRGLADAVADPAAAAATALRAASTAGGNPNFLSPEGETFRWATDAASIARRHADRRRGSACPTSTRCRPRSTPTPRSGCSAATAPGHRRPLRRRADRRRLRRRRHASSGRPDDVRIWSRCARIRRNAGQAPSSSRACSTSWLELRLERVDAVELALAAQEVGEADVGLLAVEVAVEVEQVGLEQRVVGVLVERRSAPEVDRARVDARRRAARTSRRTRRRRAGRRRSAPRRWRSGTRAGGRAGRRSTTVPRASCGRPSMRGRQLDLAAGQGPADGRAADRLVDAVAARSTSADRVDVEVELARRAPRAGATLPSRWLPEVEVVADDDDRAPPARRRAPARRTSSGASFDCASSKCITTVASTPVAASSSSRCSGSVSSCGADSGRTIVAGWRSNVTHDRACAVAFGASARDLGDDRLVAEVHAVVGADGDDGALARPRRRVEVGDHAARPADATRVRRPMHDRWLGRPPRECARTRRAARRPDRRHGPRPVARPARQHPAVRRRARRSPRRPSTARGRARPSTAAAARTRRAARPRRS